MKQINPKTIKQGDVLLVDFPYNDKKGSKQRPAVVSRVKDNHIFIVKITSQIKNHPNNIMIGNITSAGLNKTSQIQCNREIYINRYSKSILAQLGNLDQRDFINMTNKISEIHLRHAVKRSENSNSTIKQYCEKKYNNKTLMNREHDKEKERGR